MAQTAQSLSTGHTLYITGQVSSPISNIIGREKQVATDISSEGISFLLNHGTFFYNDRVRLTYQVNHSFQPYFALIKGLIEFYRSPEYSFTYNRTANSIEVDLSANNSTKLLEFLQTVFGYLKGEIEFKTALKTVLQFEREYKQKMEAVYQTLPGMNVRPF